MITVMVTPKIMKWAMVRAKQGIQENYIYESKAVLNFRILTHLGEAAFWSSYQDSFRANSENFEIVVKSRLMKDPENQKVVLSKKDIQTSDADFIVIALVSKSLKAVTLAGFESPQAILNKSVLSSHEVVNPWNERIILDVKSLLPIETMTRHQQTRVV